VARSQNQTAGPTLLKLVGRHPLSSLRGRSWSRNIREPSTSVAVAAEGLPDKRCSVRRQTSAKIDLIRPGAGDAEWGTICLGRTRTPAAIVNDISRHD